MRFQSIFLSVLFVLFFTPFFAMAKPMKICVLEDGTAVAKRRCNTEKGQSPLNMDELSETATGPAGPEGPKGDHGDTPVLCYAKIDIEGNLKSYGGARVESVTVSKEEAGVYDVTCNGDFEGISSYDNVSIIGTIQTSNSKPRTLTTSTSGRAGKGRLGTSVMTYNSSGTPTDFAFSVIFIGELP